MNENRYCNVATVKIEFISGKLHLSFNRFVKVRTIAILLQKNLVNCPITITFAAAQNIEIINNV